MTTANPMIGEVIAIGDELTSGQRLDTNSQWLAQRLGDLGVAVMYHTAVGDDLAPMVDVVRAAASRADVIVCTGGLGPTADDLTRDAIAQCAGVPLRQDDDMLNHIRGIYAQRKRPMPERNVVQAMFPEGSRAIPNPHGTAPGVDVFLERNDARGGEPLARVFALPGVPAEMKQMWDETVAPAIIEMIPPDARRVVLHRRLKCFGVGESDLEAMLPDLIHRDHYPRIGITVSRATITLRATATEIDEAECLRVIEPALATMRECLGELVFGTEDEELHHVVAQALVAQGKTLATAECFTHGLLAKWLAETPEVEDFYCGGRVRVGQSVDVFAIARDLKAETGADYALVIGAAESADGEGSAIPIALACGDEITGRSAANIGHPDIRKARAAKIALDLLRMELAKGNP